MTTLNICLILPLNQGLNIVLLQDFTRQDFINVVSRKLGNLTNDYRFIIDGRELSIREEKQFNAQKHMIINGKLIFLLKRIRGGVNDQPTGISHIIDTVLSALPSELYRLSHKNDACIICTSLTACLQLCCYSVCDNCFKGYFKSIHLQLRCMNPECTKNILSYETFFRSPEFIKIITEFHRKHELVRNIDVQICTCGTLLLNKTMYAQHTCANCKRCFCFFCNKPWDPVNMQNQQYTCKVNCDYETKITYELVHMCEEFNPSLLLPDRRCCPKCFSLGAYGGGCKFHTCTTCKYTFCFICLRSERDCRQHFQTTRPDPYAQKCDEIKEITYETFPRLHNL
jgi:hypothetical protein